MQRSGRRQRLVRRALRRDERGANLLEAAIVLPVFLFIVFALIEGSVLMRDNLTVANITTDAGRAASTYGKDQDADYYIVQEAVAAGAAVGRNQIERIVIFRASGPTGSVPSGCKSGTPTSGTGAPNYTGACNVYNTADLDDPIANFDCDASSPSRFWCPTTRHIAASSPPDYLGVYVRVRHRSLSPAFGGDRTIERTSIFRLEPQVLNE